MKKNKILKAMAVGMALMMTVAVSACGKKTEAPAENAPAEGTPAEEAPAEGAPAGEAPAEGAPAEAAPAN